MQVNKNLEEKKSCITIYVVNWHYNLTQTYFSNGGEKNDSPAKRIKKKTNPKVTGFIQQSCLLLLPGCLSPSPLILYASN